MRYVETLLSSPRLAQKKKKLTQTLPTAVDNVVLYKYESPMTSNHETVLPRSNCWGPRRGSTLKGRSTHRRQHNTERRTPAPLSLSLGTTTLRLQPYPRVFFSFILMGHSEGLLPSSGQFVNYVVIAI